MARGYALVIDYRKAERKGFYVLMRPTSNLLVQLTSGPYSGQMFRISANKLRSLLCMLFRSGHFGAWRSQSLVKAPVVPADIEKGKVRSNRELPTAQRARL